MKRISSKIWCFKWSHGHCHNFNFFLILFSLNFHKKSFSLNCHTQIFLVNIFFYLNSWSLRKERKNVWKKNRALLQQVVSRFQLQLSIQATRLISSWKKNLSCLLCFEFWLRLSLFSILLCASMLCASQWNLILSHLLHETTIDDGIV